MAAAEMAAAGLPVRPEISPSRLNKYEQQQPRFAEHRLSKDDPPLALAPDIADNGRSASSRAPTVASVSSINSWSPRLSNGTPKRSPRTELAMRSSPRTRESDNSVRVCGT